MSDTIGRTPTPRDLADAMKPLRDVAVGLEELARRLRLAAELGNTALVIEIGSELLPAVAGFAQKFRTWQATRPDRPAWQSAVADAGSDDADRCST